MANEKYILRNLLQVFTIMFLLTVMIGESKNEALFRKISNSQCIASPWLIRTQTTLTITECSLRCLATDYCRFFSYCNGTCKMFQAEAEGNFELFTCDCISYLMLDGNSRTWQKIFQITTSSFKRNALYAFWNNWPIEKVRISFVKRGHIFHYLIFNGRNKNSTAWFSEMNLLSEPWYRNLSTSYIFNLSEKYFIIEVKDGDQCMLSVEKVNETYYDIGFKMNKITSYRTPLDGLDVYVLLE